MHKIEYSTNLGKKLSRKTVKGTYYEKNVVSSGGVWSKVKVNNYLDFWSEVAGCRALNEAINADEYYAIPICTINKKHLSDVQKRYMQFNSIDAALYRLDEKKCPIGIKSDSPQFSIDFKMQMRANKYGTVNIELHAERGNGYIDDSRSIFNSKNKYQCYIIEEKVYLISREKLCEYAKAHPEHHTHNGKEAQGNDGNWKHIKKWTCRYPIEELEKNSINTGVILPEDLEVLQKRLDDILDHNEWLSDKHFSWLPDAMKRSEEYYKRKNDESV